MSEVEKGQSGQSAKRSRQPEVRQVTTSFGAAIKPVYGPEDLENFSPEEELGEPGEFPYTRGIYPNMYRSEYWTRRNYAGMQTSEDTNTRFKFLLSNGQTGLSMALDLPTQLGMDSDDPEAVDDVGRVGVAIDTLADMERIYEGIPMAKVNTSFTINATASTILAMYIVAAEKQGVPMDQLRGTVQNDVLKEYIARGMWIFPPEPSLKITGDIVEFCARNLPKFNPISVSGTHIAECGANSIQVMAYPMLNAICYIDEVLKRGLTIDEFAPQITFHLPAGGLENYGLWESIAKFRAGRRVWARLLQERYGAKDPRSLRFKFSTGVGGSGLTATQPLNNIARLAYYALTAVLSGTRSLNLASFDEALAIPTELSTRTSLMIQHILAYETGFPDVVDPLAGSYFIESLTNEIEEKIVKLMKEVEDNGGVMKAIAAGSIQKDLGRQAYDWEVAIERKEVMKVGVNCFQVEEEEGNPDVYEHAEDAGARQLVRLKETKAKRDTAAVQRTLGELRRAAEARENLMPSLLEAVRAYATIGEISGVLMSIYGGFGDPVQM
jgi:methylmalonyl-CoA mutase N-terminal domain/subunit